MSLKSPNVCPFGEGLQKYWDRRYEYFLKFDDGIQTDDEGLYSVIPEQTALDQAARVSGNIVIDAFAGIGGSSIGLARQGKQVIAIEKNPIRFAMARHNTGVYGVQDRVKVVKGDFFDLSQRVVADTVNLDPPWGGPSYKEHGKFLLEHFAPDGNEILRHSLDNFKEVVLRVPTVFDFAELERFDRAWEAQDDVSMGRVISQTVIFR